ncbi:hypothetical protein GIB67_040316 [Kingdonia uniflora]|uniref:Protein kinase domain-containing protein n=1 Tax=Kingdonia uniflora TaxID=39325 RepID=A0A7J7MVH6_9MAGN|nr:hypothetical protein GIB67_040316 [Kingdonia uniflora]
MAVSNLCVSLTVVIFLAVLTSPTSSWTDPSDVSALRDLYRSLNNPPQLIGWNSIGGDPCEESWKGISCSGSSVIFIKLNELELRGHFGNQLSNMLNLKQLDVSFNQIQGEIPMLLPPNATHIDLSFNNFSQSIPYSLTFMKHLHHLNFSHNSLSGPVGNVFSGLQNLRQMDLSYNNFSRDLPNSFENLKNLSGLFLQNNGFTGSVIYLANLHLTYLNIQNNHFSSVVPKQFQSIPNLWIGGNRFQFGADYPPWDFPEAIPGDLNSPPTTESSAIENYPSLGAGKSKKGRLTFGGIASMVGGIALVVTCAAAIIAIRIHKSRKSKLESSESDVSSFHDLPISTTTDRTFAAPTEDNLQSLPSRTLDMLGPRRLPPVRHSTTDYMHRRRSFSRKCKTPVTAKMYTVAELQCATNSFSEDNLLGEGSLGSVYKANFPDGKIFAVKNVNTVALSLHEEEQFLDVIWNVARLRHPNIVTLVGYCMEHGQHLLVYEYVPNWSLVNALHCNEYKHLPWSIRIKIALGVARALDYLHSACSPPVAHNNLKAANILLGDDLMPYLCDCGLNVLRPLTSNSVKLKASEMAVGCTGYTAPESSQPGTDKLKSDIFAFGVLLLELMTGRKPFDSSRPRDEQCLVKWASTRLHDHDSLEEMVDPVTKRMFTSKSLSRFADIITLCIQAEPEFRPTMSEVVEYLVRLIDRGMGDGAELEVLESSFKTLSGFNYSPLTSYASA